MYTAKEDITLPDLCPYCGVNKPNPSLTNQFSGLDHRIWPGLRLFINEIRESVTVHQLTIPLCDTCHAKYEKDAAATNGFAIVSLILMGVGLFGGIFTLLYVPPLALIFLIMFAAGAGLVYLINLLYKIQLGGWNEGGWWFKEIKYEKEFARLNPSALSARRKARLNRMMNKGS